MTDTEILDYLSDAVTYRPRGAHDVQIGSVTFTLGVGHGSLRDRMVKAIEADQARIVTAVSQKLGVSEETLTTDDILDSWRYGLRRPRIQES